MDEFSVAEVERHKSKTDLWFTYKNKVINITPFVDKHPGGFDVLLNHAHGDADVTEVMKSGPHEHSKAAYSILNKYVIGKLEGTEDVDGKDGETGFYDWSEDKLVDWSKPIFWQVGGLGTKYMEWCHKPVDKQIRLFYSDFCEFFSKTKWWIIPIVWLPLVALLCLQSYQSFSLNADISGFAVTASHLPVLLFAGACFWSFVEYVVHRWLFHLTPPANSAFLITLHFILHGQHHKAPFDHLRLVFPPVPGMIFLAFFYLSYLLVFPKPIALGLLAGTGLGYIGYDLTHYFLHHGGAPKSKYFQNLKRYHNAHHFEHQMKGFGISSKLWDYPFDTLIPGQ